MASRAGCSGRLHVCAAAPSAWDQIALRLCLSWMWPTTLQSREPRSGRPAAQWSWSRWQAEWKPGSRSRSATAASAGASQLTARLRA